MAILTMPALPLFESAEFRLEARTFAHTSIFDGSTDTVTTPGAHWQLEAALPGMGRDDAAPWLAFLTNLDGRAGRFFAGDPRGKVPRGGATGTPLVAGAGQTGATLATDGWTLSVTGILLTADYFALDLPSGGRSLHQMKADADSDGGGAATLAFRPALRESPADNAPLIVQGPTCVMRLIDDEQARWRMSGPIYEIAFSAIEAFKP